MQYRFIGKTARGIPDGQGGLRNVFPGEIIESEKPIINNLFVATDAPADKPARKNKKSEVKDNA